MWGALAGAAKWAGGMVGRGLDKFGDHATAMGVAGLGYKGVQATNRANQEEAEKNRRFQENMSNTAWQRGVKDMEAAGLNPALAYGQGGASSPGGSMATMQDAAAPAINSALAFKANKQMIAKQAAEIRATNVGTRIARREGLERINGLRLQNQHSALGLQRAGAEADIARGVGQAVGWSRQGYTAARRGARIGGFEADRLMRSWWSSQPWLRNPAPGLSRAIERFRNRRKN